MTFIDTDITDRVAVVTINRPEKLNALSSEMLVQLTGIIEEYGDKEGVDGLVITGAGNAFTAGHDLTSGSELGQGKSLIEAVDEFHNISRALLKTQVPTVAAINGISVGGGFEMTLACDRRVGSEAAEIYLPENSLGLVISNGSSILLKKLMGQSAALDFVLGSRRLSAAEAVQAGLIDEIVSGDLMTHCKRIIAQYNSDVGTVRYHLKLLRPSIQEVEAAMLNETVEAIRAWEDGVTQKAAQKFLDRKK